MVEGEIVFDQVILHFFLDSKDFWVVYSPEILSILLGVRLDLNVTRKEILQNLLVEETLVV